MKPNKKKQPPFIIGDHVSSGSNSKSKETFSNDGKHSTSRESKLIKKQDNSIEEISKIKKSIMFDQKIFIKRMGLDKVNQKRINEILVNSFQNKSLLPKELICFEYDNNKTINEVKDKLSYFRLFESFKIKKTAISIDQFTVLFLDHPLIYEEYAKIFRYLTIIRKFHIIIQQENVKLILKKEQFFEKTKETKKTFFTIYIDFYQSIIS